MEPERVNSFKPAFIVTGGQTGADSIPFEIFSDLNSLNIRVKGWMPKDFRRDDGNGAEIARKYGLKEGAGGHAWRDKKNEEMSDGLIAFLVSLPKTGRGTLTTLNKFKTGSYQFVHIDKPQNEKFLIVRGKKPSLILWDISADTQKDDIIIITNFLNEFKPKNLMIAGSTSHTIPDIHKVGGELLREIWRDELNRIGNK